MPKVCKPIEVKLENQSELMLRRMVLESLGWRLWCEDGERTNDHTNYVYWVGPNGEQHAHWWAEGEYKWNMHYHWFPPEFPIEELLKGYEWQVHAMPTETGMWYRVTLKTRWTTAVASKSELEIAIYSTIVMAFSSAPAEHKPKPYKEVQE